MKTFSRIILLLLAWGLALFAALRLGSVPVDWGHVCGPWGCGPPLKALLAWHGFWGILLALPVLLAIVYWPGRRLQRVGLVLTAAGLLGLAGIAVWLAGVLGPRPKRRLNHDGFVPGDSADLSIQCRRAEQPGNGGRFFHKEK